MSKPPPRTFENRPAINTESPDIRLGRVESDDPAAEPLPSSLLRWQGRGMSNMVQEDAQEAFEKKITVDQLYEQREQQKIDSDNAERDPSQTAEYGQHVEDMTAKLNDQLAEDRASLETNSNNYINSSGFTTSETVQVEPVNDNSLFGAKTEGKSQDQNNDLHLGGGLFSRDRNYDQGNGISD